MAIILPCEYLIADLRKEIVKWGTYIETNIEDGITLKYETELSKYYAKYSENESFNPIGFAYWMFTIISIVMTTIFVIYSTIFSKTDVTIISIGIAIIFVIAILLFTLNGGVVTTKISL